MLRTLFSFLTHAIGWAFLVCYDPALVLWAGPDMVAWLAARVATMNSKDLVLCVLVFWATSLLVMASVAFIFEQPIFNGLTYILIATACRTVLTIYSALALMVTNDR